MHAFLVYRGYKFLAEDVEEEDNGNDDKKAMALTADCREIPGVAEVYM